MTTEEAFIYLSACIVNHATVDTAVLPIDFELVYDIASNNQMTALIASALEWTGITEPHFKQGRAKAVRKAIIFDAERTRILAELEAAHIWYMPLKGVILKDYYPQVGMRQMSDNDILFDAARADDVKTIMENLGFSTVHFGIGHQDDYQKPPVSHFEMHRMLFAPTSDEKLYKYYRDVKKRLLKDKGNDYGYHFTNEDFYIYMIAHEYKHYSWGGTGIRSLLDTYVFLRKLQNSLDWNYVNLECSRLEIGEFEKENRDLALAVFSKGSMEGLTPEQKEMLDYYFHSGAYGTKEHVIENNVKKSGKLKYIWNRMFPPMKVIKEHYPSFYKNKLLIPVLPVYRIVKRWSNAKQEIRTIGKI